MYLLLRGRFLLLTILGVLLSCYAICAQNSYQGIPLSQHFSPEDYQAGIQNWAVLQDQQGIVYVANNFGMLAYDGIEWQLHRIQESTRARSLLAATDGKIYVGGPNNFGYFTPNEIGQLAYTSLSQLLPKENQSFEEIWRIYEIDDYIYFCSFLSIFKYHPAKGLSIIASPKPPLGFSFSVEGRLMSMTTEGLAVLETNNALQLVPNGGLLKDLQVTGIIPLGKQRLLILSHNQGIWVFDYNTLRPWSHQNSEFDETLINCAIRLQDGNIAIGTQNDGLLIFDPNGNLVNQITEGKGLQNRTVLAIYQDLLGNLWLGLNNGLAHIELASPFSIIGKELGVPGAGYAAIKANGVLYLGTSNGLFARPEDSRGQFQLVKGSEGQVYHLSLIQNQLFMGHHQGAFLIEEMTAKPLGSPLGAWKFMQLSRAPNQLIQGSYQGFHRYEKQQNEWKYQEKISDFTESSRVFEEGKNHNIWMSHGYKGIYRLQLSEDLKSISQIDFYDEKNGFPSKLLINVFKVQNQLVFCAETGVFEFDSTQNRFIQSKLLGEYFTSEEHISELSEDVIGNIYYHGNRGMGFLRQLPVSGYERKEDGFNRINSLISDDLENITPIDPSNILIGAKRGFVHYNPQQQVSMPDSFQVLLREIVGTSRKDTTWFYDNNHKQYQNTAFSYDDNNLQFRYAANFYIGTSNTKYSYFLEGFDEGWSEWGGKTEKEYTNLPPSHYTFKVKAQSIYGQQSQELTYHFKILPPWYRTNTAYGFYGLLIAMSLATIIITLNKKYQQEKRLMVLKQERALNQKDTQLKEVTQQSEATINHLQNEKLEAEIKHKTQELATATMSLLHKNEFMSQLKVQINSIKKKSSKTTAKELEKVIKNIDKDIASDNSWEQFEHQFAQVYGDFSSRIQEDYPELTPQEMKLCAYLRMNMSTKEIASLLSISVRGVEIARYRLRKKLALDRTDNLVHFILNF